LLHRGIVHQAFVRRIIQLIGKHNSLISRQTVVYLNIQIGRYTHQYFELQFGERHSVSGRNDTRLHAAHLYLGADFVKFTHRTLPVFSVDYIIIVFCQLIAFLQNIV